MSDDALAALLVEMYESDDPDLCSPRNEADWLRAHGVFVFPHDHPLRTGEPNEAMIEAACDAAYEEGAFHRAVVAGVRAALAVLREP